MAKITYLPLYNAEYLTDCAHLTTLEHGAYLLLLLHYWQHAKPLPNEDKILARMAKLSEAKFQKIKPILKNLFFITETEWKHDGIENELAKCRRTSEVRRAAVQVAIRNRKEKDSTNVQQMFNKCSTNVQQMLNPENDLFGEEMDGQMDGQKDQMRTKIPPCPHEAIIDLYHSMLPMCPQVLKWTSGRQAQLKQRWREYPDLNLWRQFFDIVKDSRFLTGRVTTAPGRKTFVATLAWLIKAENFAKVLEGNYDEKF